MPLGLRRGAASSPYDRTRILSEATKARKKGKRKKALTLYERIIQNEPENIEVLRRLAPLLAQNRRPVDAWKAFRKVGESMAEAGFADKAIGVYREAARYLADYAEVYEALAAAQLKARSRADAVQTLLEGRRQFRNRRRRPQAVRLLRRVREIDPQALNPTLDLARLLRKTGSRAEAMRILREIESSCTGRPLRRVRGAQLRGSPTPRQFWLWLRALILRR